MMNWFSTTTEKEESCQEILQKISRTSNSASIMKARKDISSSKLKPITEFFAKRTQCLSILELPTFYRTKVTKDFKVHTLCLFSLLTVIQKSTSALILKDLDSLAMRPKEYHGLTMMNMGISKKPRYSSCRLLTCMVSNGN